MLNIINELRAAARDGMVRSTVLVATVFWVGACQVDQAAVPVASVAFYNLVDSLLVGKTKQTDIYIRDAKGNDLTGRTPKYESQNPQFATVDSKGLVTGVAAGNAIIKASLEGRSTTETFKVLDKATRVVVTRVRENIPVGQSRQLSVTVSAANGTTISGRSIKFQTSAPGVAIVSTTGLITAISRGRAFISAEAELDQVSGVDTVDVVDVPVAVVTLAPIGPQTLRLGNTLQATATARDANNNALTGRAVSWTSSNPTIATVNPTSGLIAALAVGSVTITAEIETRTAQMSVQVTEVPPKTVTLTPDTVQVQTSVTRQITSTVIDSLNRTVTSFANRSVIWSSNNQAVASVSASGVVTGLTSGTARISLTVDNVRSNDVIVVVTDQVASIRLTPFQQQLLRVGNTLQVTAQALNNQNQVIPGKTFNWSSSNPAFATVNATTGLVTAVAPGTATITAETEGKTGSVNVQVTLVPIGTVSIVPSTDTLVAGDTKQYNPVVTDTAGKPVNSLTGRVVDWTSNNIPIASVSNQGIVTASSSSTGTAVLRVTIDGVVSNTLTVRVAQVASIVVTPNPITVGVGQNVTLTVVLKDGAGNVLHTNRILQFTPSGANPNAINTTPAGLITGVTAGNSQVTVTVSGIFGVSAVVPVTVTP